MDGVLLEWEYSKINFNEDDEAYYPINKVRLEILILDAPHDYIFIIIWKFPFYSFEVNSVTFIATGKRVLQFTQNSKTANKTPEGLYLELMGEKDFKNKLISLNKRDANTSVNIKYYFFFSFSWKKEFFTREYMFFAFRNILLQETEFLRIGRCARSSRS